MSRILTPDELRQAQAQIGHKAQLEEAACQQAALVNTVVSLLNRCALALEVLAIDRLANDGRRTALSVSLENSRSIAAIFEQMAANVSAIGEQIREARDAEGTEEAPRESES